MATINFTDFEGQTRTVDAAAGLGRVGQPRGHACR